jgi:hypothetical protein
MQTNKWPKTKWVKPQNKSAYEEVSWESNTKPADGKFRASENSRLVGVKINGVGNPSGPHATR